MENLQIIQCDSESGILMLDILELKAECSFCGKNITKENFGGVFSKPNRACCNNVCCLIEALKD